MKLLSATIAAALTLLVPSDAQSDPQAISKDTARKAIELFCANPLSEDADGAASIILKFAEASSDIHITITVKALPWFNNPTPVKHSQQLLGAFLAGNVKSQLTTGTAKNDPYAGVLQVIATYRQIQKREPDFKLAEVEHLIELANQKKLKEHLETP